MTAKRGSRWRKWRQWTTRQWSMRQWSVWRIACALGELHGTDALDDDSVVALLFLAELIDLTDRQATYSIACGVVVGAGVRKLDRYHANDSKPPKKRRR